MQREARRLLLDSWHAVRANVVSSPWHEGRSACVHRGRGACARAGGVLHLSAHQRMRACTYLQAHQHMPTCTLTHMLQAESQLVYVRATKRLQSMLSHKPTLAFVDRGKKIGSGGGQLEVVSERSLEVSDIVSDGGWYVLQRAVQAVPSSVTLQVLHAREMMVRGFGIGSKEGASNVFERAVHMEPQSVAAAVALGWWEEQGGGWRRAILQYLRALALLRRATVGGWPESDFVSDFVHATAQNVDKVVQSVYTICACLPACASPDTGMCAQMHTCMQLPTRTRNACHIHGAGWRGGRRPPTDPGAGATSQGLCCYSFSRRRASWSSRV